MADHCLVCLMLPLSLPTSEAEAFCAHAPCMHRSPRANVACTTIFFFKLLQRLQVNNLYFTLCVSLAAGVCIYLLIIAAVCLKLNVDLHRISTGLHSSNSYRSPTRRISNTVHLGSTLSNGPIPSLPHSGVPIRIHHQHAHQVTESRVHLARRQRIGHSQSQLSDHPYGRNTAPTNPP